MKALFTLMALPALAALSLTAPAAAQDVVIIGEVHDNPAHHAYQAAKVRAVSPRVLVMEMLTPDQARLIQSEPGKDRAALARALRWEESGWPDFGLYHPIVTAVEDVEIYGTAMTAAQRQDVRDGQLNLMMGDDAAQYGLGDPLPVAQQQAREKLQFEAHCQMVPLSAMGRMVAVQRLRDAMLARAVIEGVENTGGPVVVITGNGHARRDWGIPAILSRVAPQLDVHVIGQTEDNQPLAGGYDEIHSAPSVDRGDPCDAFR